MGAYPTLLWYKKRGKLLAKKMKILNEQLRFESAKGQINPEIQRKREEIRKAYKEKYGEDINVYADCVKSELDMHMDLQDVIKHSKETKKKFRSKNRKIERERDAWVRDKADKMKISLMKTAARPRLLNRSIDLQNESSDDHSDDSDESDEERGNVFKYP